MKSIYIIPIEPIDQRYTAQWYVNIPKILSAATDQYRIVTIDGASVGDNTTKGAFLDFAATNVYKSSQLETISRMFSQGLINPGDKFLITDAWNFSVVAIKYMSELLNIPVEIHSIWHAGAYDPTDILGMKMSKPWPNEFEKSVYYASDYNYFATNFHKDMFLRNLNISDSSKAFRSGQPHDLIVDELLSMASNNKENIIMWPHRLNDDKQPEIVYDLDEELPYNFLITQKMNLSKDEYYRTMSKSKIIFSCSLHENLGISMMEGALLGSIPIVPDRASYSEMYLKYFKYPSEWTENFDKYMMNRHLLVAFIEERIQNYNQYSLLLDAQKHILIDNYMTSSIMVNKLIS